MGLILPYYINPTTKYTLGSIFGHCFPSHWIFHALHIHGEREWLESWENKTDKKL